MRTLIELANSLIQSHQLANSAEKRRLVEITTSNRRVMGKEVYLEPSNWLDEVDNLMVVPVGDPRRSRDRTVEELLASANDMVVIGCRGVLPCARDDSRTDTSGLADLIDSVAKLS